MSGSPASARYSDAIATQPSVSAISAGLQAIGIADDRERVGRGDQQRVEAVEPLARAAAAPCPGRRRRAAVAPTKRAATSESLSVSKTDALGHQLAPDAWRGWRTSRCAPGRSPATPRTDAQWADGHGGLRRHPGVGDRLPAGRGGEREPGREVVRVTGALEDGEVGAVSRDDDAGQRGSGGLGERRARHVRGETTAMPGSSATATGPDPSASACRRRRRRPVGEQESVRAAVSAPSASP